MFCKSFQTNSIISFRKQINDFLQIPNVICDAGLRRWGDAQRLMTFAIATSEESSLLMRIVGARIPRGAKKALVPKESDLGFGGLDVCDRPNGSAIKSSDPWF
jgi:hypothetical protein